MGGIAQVDIRAHAAALQAKVAARLLWPHKQPWKVYMRDAFQRGCPGVGVAVLVQQTRQAGAGALQPRHQLYLTAFRQVGLQRHLPHDQMSVQQIRLEPLVGNHSVCQPTTGDMFSADAQLPQQYRQLATKTVGAAATAQQQQQHHFPGLLLPPAWTQRLQGPAAQDPWQMLADGLWVRRSVAGGHQHYRVLPSSKLEQVAPQDVPAAVTSAVVGWQACCVVDTAAVLHPQAVARERQRGQRSAPRRQEAAAMEAQPLQQQQQQQQQQR